MSLSILSLPVELISNILEYNDYRTIIACRKSCRRLKDIVDASSALTYTIELVAAGMCDGAPNGVGPTERLRRLRSSQSCWESPSPTWFQPDNFPYSDRIFSCLLAMSGNLAIFCETTFRSREIEKLLLLRFPSDLRGIPGQQWYLDFKSEEIKRHGICADDSQDLLIFLSPLYVHIRTLSTGAVHPLTNTLGYIDSGMPYFSQSIFYSHIYNDLVSFVWSQLGSYYMVVVFNWKTGEQILKIPCPGYLSGCTFLDGSNVIFPYRTNDGEGVTRLRVVTLPSTANSTPLRFYDFALDLPAFHGYHVYLTHYLCVNTLPSNPSGSCFPGLFHVDHRSKILVFRTHNHPMGSTGWSMLHVPHDTFLSYIATHSAEPDTVAVPWIEWGPGNSHLFDVSNAPLIDIVER
ncbi:hypothetical protein BJV78DRAFT_563719 [Lactifluus subvellereus]|nr:hypothetical protein BJV78DRAFT_563719 [Lactifluus subvellereus]